MRQQRAGSVSRHELEIDAAGVAGRLCGFGLAAAVERIGDTDATPGTTLRASGSDDALRSEVRGLRPVVDDPRLCAFLQAVFGFGRSEPWTIAELIFEARRARDYEVLEAINAIVDEGLDCAKSLGSWLKGRANVECGGLRLERLRQDENGTWIYRVVLGGSKPRDSLCAASITSA
jgi:hypothetical protein